MPSAENSTLTEWSAERVRAAKSPYYPLCNSGELAPLLADEDMLLDIYDSAGLRHVIKQICKTRFWAGKPNYSVLTESKLKLVLLSMCNSPQARRMLKSESLKGDSLNLYQAIWESNKAKNKNLHLEISNLCENISEKLFIKPDALGKYLRKHAVGASELERTSMIQIALAFAMLQEDVCEQIIAELVNAFPETRKELGLDTEDAQLPKDLLPNVIESIAMDFSKTQVAYPSTELFKANTYEIDVPHVNCWTEVVDVLLRELQELKEASETFSKNSIQLTELRTLDDFASTAAATSLLSCLDSDRRIIDGKYKIVQSYLGRSCSNIVGDGCELHNLMQSNSQLLSNTLPLFLEKLMGAREVNENLLRSAELASTEILELREIHKHLSQSLLSPPISISSIQERDTPCSILKLLEQHRKCIVDLKIKLSSEIANRKGELLLEVDQLTSRVNAGGSAIDKEAISKFQNLRANIVSAETFSEVLSYRGRFDEIQIQCAECFQNSLHTLATQMHGNLESISDYLNLCRRLDDRNESEVALLLLHLRQQLHPIEEISEFPENALGHLLNSAFSAVSSGFEFSVVWESLCLAPWLLGIGRNDIDSPDLIENLFVFFLGGAVHCNIERPAAILRNIGAAEYCRSLPLVLQDILKALLIGRQFRFVSNIDFFRIREQVENIRERISVEGNKYRHIQCGNAVYFPRFEAMRVFPALEGLWSEIEISLDNRDFRGAHLRLGNIDIEAWYYELNRTHDRPVEDHPRFTAKIIAFMNDFLSLLQEHVALCEHVQGSGSHLIVENEIRSALQEWAGTKEKRLELAALTIGNLARPSSCEGLNVPLLSSVTTNRAVLMRCPNAITFLCRQVSFDGDVNLERLVLNDLAVDFELDEVLNIYQTESAWQQLVIIARSGITVDPGDWIVKYQQALEDLTSKRGVILASENGRHLDAFDACVRGGRIPAAHQLFTLCSNNADALRAQGMTAIASFVTDQLNRINHSKDIAADANMSEQWQENICTLAAKIERRLRQLSRSIEHAEVVGAEKMRLHGAVDALMFVVTERSQVFDEVLHRLSLPTTVEASTSQNLASKELAAEKCPEFFQAWSSLSSVASTEIDPKRAWTQFVKEFAKLCDLYHDDNDDQNRFVSVPSIKYPFAVYQTAFYKPQSEFLKRPLRLYLYRQNEIDNLALQRLEAELSGDASNGWLHIVFAPQGLEKIHRFFRYNSGFRGFLIVDEKLAYQIAIEEKHVVPFRQALHLSERNLASSSPFVAQGYCHQLNNIYVGRTDTRRKLLNTPQALIWGGRRIGKTSVLHALETALGHHTRKYNVAYVYVNLEDQADPDVAIARKIAATLCLPDVSTLTEFEKIISERRKDGQRFAFLIDEVDEYIKKSRKVHGDDFPLATVLRQLVMDDREKETILVYSGFHQLYYEAQLNRETRRVSQPFINLGQNIPIGDLTYDDVNELVMTGFQEMLGMNVSPDVPRLISAYASRHPAFVQQFCRCLLEQVSKRRTPDGRVTITKDDVEAVYHAHTSSEGGEQPFIFYVNETLGYNLSYLGRAIMISICNNPVEGSLIDVGEDYFSMSSVKSDLHVWCDVIGMKYPEEEHFQQTINLLEMTNMLTQNPEEPKKYRLTYPTYREILRRLDKLDQADAVDWLKKYDSKERKKGILL